MLFKRSLTNDQTLEFPSMLTIASSVTDPLSRIDLLITLTVDYSSLT